MSSGRKAECQNIRAKSSLVGAVESYAPVRITPAQVTRTCWTPPFAAFLWCHLNSFSRRLQGAEIRPPRASQVRLWARAPLCVGVCVGACVCTRPPARPQRRSRTHTPAGPRAHAARREPARWGACLAGFIYKAEVPVTEF